MSATRNRQQATRYRVTGLRYCKRLRFWLVSCLLSLVSCLLFVSVAYARHVSSTELVENPRFYDGKTVTYQGEAVGEVMIRGEMAWIHVNDDKYSVARKNEGKRLFGYNSGHSIWLKASKARKINHFGSYKRRGDIVRVEGTFNKACPEHGGEMDIHAEKLTVVKRGAPFGYLLDFNKVIVAGILGLLSLGLYLLYRVVQKRRPQESKA